MKKQNQGRSDNLTVPVLLAAAAGAALSILLLLRQKKHAKIRPESVPAGSSLRTGQAAPAAPANERQVPPSGAVPKVTNLDAPRRPAAAHGFLSLVLILAGLAAAYIGQGVFNNWHEDGIKIHWLKLDGLSEPQLILTGSVFMLAGCLLWLLAFRRMPARGPGGSASFTGFHDLWPKIEIHIDYSILRTWLAAIGMGLSVLTTLIYGVLGESPMMRWIWLAGIVIFLAALIPAGSRGDKSGEASPPFRWYNILILGLILTGGLWLRMIRLEMIPFDFHGDMASEGLFARDLLLGVEKNVFHTSWAGLPEIAFLPAMLTMKLFGNNLFGLRMSAVMSGFFSLLALYLLAWRLFDSHRLASTSAAILAINIPFIHFSRIPGYMEAMPGILFGFYFLVDGLRGQRKGSLALAGAILGLAFEMYFSVRIIIPILILLFLYLYFFHRSWITANWAGLGLMGVAALMVSGPFLVYYLRDPAPFMTRTQDVWIFTPDVMKHLVGKYAVTGPAGAILEQVKRSLLMFNYYGDSSTQFGYGSPMFHWLTAPLVPLGAFVSLRKWRQSGAVLALVWVALGILFGSILTVDAPFWPRLVVILPMAAILAGLALEALLGVIEALGGRILRITGTILCVVYLTVAGVLAWSQYYPRVSTYIHPEAMVGRFLYSLPPDIPACGFGYPFGVSVRETAFLAWPRQLVDLPLDPAEVDLTVCPNSPVVWIFTRDSLSRLEDVKQGWPGGTLTEHVTSNGDYLFTSYLVGADYAVITQPGGNPTAGPLGDPAPAVTSILGSLVLMLAAGMCTAGLWNMRLRLPAFTLLDRRVSLPAVHFAMPGKLAKLVVRPGRSPAIPAMPRLKQSGLARALVLPAVALSLVILAQAFFDAPSQSGLHLPFIDNLTITDETRFWSGAILILAGTTIWIVRMRPRNSGDEQGKASQAIKLGALFPFLRGQARMPLVLGEVTLGCTVVGMAGYALAGETALIRWLWLAGMALALASAWRAQALWPATGRRESSPHFKPVHLAALAVLLVAAAGLRLYRLDSIPYEISTDMASYGLFAREYVLGHTNQFFGEGWYYIPRVEFFLAALTMRWAGNNLFGLYLATVIYGMVNILAGYLLIWRLADNHRLALLTTAVLAFNPAHIELSRISNFMTPWAPGYLAMFLFIDGLRGRKILSLAGAGLLTGLTLQVYPAGRILPIILLLVLAYAWFLRRDWITDNLAGLGFMGLAGLAALGPNLVYILQDWEVYTARSNEVSLFTPEIQAHLKFTYRTDSSWVVFWEQVRRTFFTFQYYTDTSAQFAYPYPLFSSYLAPLLPLGFGTAITRLRKPIYFLMMALFIVILVTGGVMTVNAPTWVRLVGMFPAAAFLIALPLDGLLRRIPGYLPRWGKSALAGLVSLFLILVGIRDWNVYVQTVDRYGRPAVQAARYIASLPEETTVCGVTEGFNLRWAEVQFMGWPRNITSLDENSPDLAYPACAARPAVWIFTPDKTKTMEQVRTLYPGGFEEYPPDYEGYIDIVAYRLD